MWPFTRRVPAAVAVPRRWFQAGDGTYYRNIHLVLDEIGQAYRLPAFTPGTVGLLASLRQELEELQTAGVIRRSCLGPFDMPAAPVAFG